MAATVEWVTPDESISESAAKGIQEDQDLGEIIEIAEQSPQPLQTHLVAWAGIAQGLLDNALAQEADGTWDATKFKASGIEITNLGGPLV